MSSGMPPVRWLRRISRRVRADSAARGGMGPRRSPQHNSRSFGGRGGEGREGMANTKSEGGAVLVRDGSSQVHHGRFI